MRLSDVLQLNEKTYTQKGNGVQGKILSVTAPTEKNNWWNQAVMLRGIDNSQSQIIHQSQYPDSMLNQSHIGKDSTWRLKWWFNKNQQRQIIVGYPETKIPGEECMTNQAQPAVPYNVPQSPPQPAQAANYPQTQKYTERDACICRQCAGKVAGEVVAAFMTSMPADEPYSLQQAIADLLTISDTMAMYFLEGVSKAADPEMVGADPNNFLPDGKPL